MILIWEGGGGGGCFFFSSRRRHTRLQGDWSSDVCSSDLKAVRLMPVAHREAANKVLESMILQQQQPAHSNVDRKSVV